MPCAAVSEDRLRQLENLHVLGDPMRLAQVFRNVISNALKFSYPGTAVSIRAVWCLDQLLVEGSVYYQSLYFVYSVSHSGAESAESFVRCDHLEAAGSVQISFTDGGPGGFIFQLFVFEVT